MKEANYSLINSGSLDEVNKKVKEIYDEITNGKKIRKRDNYISWDEYFMGIALLSAQRSKDPSTQVGACIVNQEKKIIGMGYNGFPIGCSDDELPWERDGRYMDTKYAYICHAELNAILNSMGRDLNDCSIYVALFPCNECAKAIIQSGIKEVIYLDDKYSETDAVKASKIMFNQAGVRYRRLFPKKDKIEIKFLT
jgi:dCMP deaminase